MRLRSTRVFVATALVSASLGGFCSLGTADAQPKVPMCGSGEYIAPRPPNGVPETDKLGYLGTITFVSWPSKLHIKSIHANLQFTGTIITASGTSVAGKIESTSADQLPFSVRTYTIVSATKMKVDTRSCSA
jgi:hypothetical protein